LFARGQTNCASCPRTARFNFLRFLDCDSASFDRANKHYKRAETEVRITIGIGF
jgi:hypothetical protein